jgi:hypothetical protein
MKYQLMSYREKKHKRKNVQGNGRKRRKNLEYLSQKGNIQTNGATIRGKGAYKVNIRVSL